MQCAVLIDTLRWGVFLLHLTALVYHEDYKTRSEARQSIFEYIEVFYNRKRRHAFLNYMTPVEYEKKFASN